MIRPPRRPDRRPYAEASSRPRLAWRSERRRLYLGAAVCAVAALAAILVAYRVSLLPPALHPREVVFSVAQAEALVDTPTSQLTDQAENRDVAGPPIQAQYLTLLLYTDSFRREIARAAGIPGQEVSVSGPFTLWNLTPLTVPVGASVPSILPVNKNYRLLVDVDGVNPMMTFYGQAPTTRAAIAIVNAARGMLQRYVAQREASFPVAPEYRVSLRPLGATTGGVVDPTGRIQLMGFVFVLSLLLGGGLVALAEVRRRPGGRRRPAPAPISVPGPRAGDQPADDWPHTRRLLPWFLAVFVGAIFLVPIESITLPLHLPFGSTPDRVLLVVLAFLWFVSLMMFTGPARPRVRFTRVHVLLFAFVGLACAGIALNGHTLGTYQEVTPVLKKLVVLFSLVLLFMIAASSLRPREIAKMLQFILALGVIVAIASIIEAREHFDIFYSLWAKVLPVQPPPSLDTLDSIGRLSIEGPTTQPLELASLLSMVLPIAIIGAIDATTRRRRLLYLLAMAIVLGGAVATDRKTSVVTPVIGVLVLLAYRPRPVIRGILISALPVFLVVHLAAPGHIGSTLSELLPGNINSVATTQDRTARYDAVRPDVMSHLLLGRGFESYDPHKYRILDNEYLGLLIGTGAVGLTLYLAVFGALFGFGHAMIRGPNRRDASSALALQAALAIACVSNVLFDVLSFSHVSYLFVLVGAMIVALRTRSTMEVSPDTVEPRSVRAHREPSAHRRFAPPERRSPALTPR